MTMPDSIADFFDMGGYAFYVWWSYAVVLVVLVFNFVVPAIKLRRVRRALVRRAHPAEAGRHEP